MHVMNSTLRASIIVAIMITKKKNLPFITVEFIKKCVLTVVNKLYLEKIINLKRLDFQPELVCGKVKNHEIIYFLN